MQCPFCLSRTAQSYGQNVILLLVETASYSGKPFLVEGQGAHDFSLSRGREWVEGRTGFLLYFSTALGTSRGSAASLSGTGAGCLLSKRKSRWLILTWTSLKRSWSVVGAWPFKSFVLYWELTVRQESSVFLPALHPSSSPYPIVTQPWLTQSLPKAYPSICHHKTQLLIGPCVTLCLCSWDLVHPDWKSRPP